MPFSMSVWDVRKEGVVDMKYLLNTFKSDAASAIKGRRTSRSKSAARKRA